MENDLVLQFPVCAEERPLTDEKAIMEMITGLKTLIAMKAIKGRLDEILKDYEINLNTGFTKAYLEPTSLCDGSKLNAIDNSGIYEVPREYIIKVDLSDSEKTFSVATIQERLRLAKMPPKIRLRNTIMDYKRYYIAKKNDFQKDPIKFKQLKNMFLTDLMGLFTEILPLIEEGKQLNSLLGVSQVSPKLTAIARDLSLIYRRALKIEKSSGQINKGPYQKLKETYSQFLDQLTEVVFPGSSEIKISGDKGSVNLNPIQHHVTEDVSDTKKYSYYPDGRIKLFESNKDRIKLFK